MFVEFTDFRDARLDVSSQRDAGAIERQFNVWTGGWKSNLSLDFGVSEKDPIGSST
jgi:hypothetical protein